MLHAAGEQKALNRQQCQIRKKEQLYIVQGNIIIASTDCLVRLLSLYYHCVSLVYKGTKTGLSSYSTYNWTPAECFYALHKIKLGLLATLKLPAAAAVQEAPDFLSKAKQWF